MNLKGLIEIGNQIVKQGSSEREGGAMYDEHEFWEWVLENRLDLIEYLVGSKENRAEKEDDFREDFESYLAEEKEAMDQLNYEYSLSRGV